MLGSGCAKLRNVASSVIAEVGLIVRTVLCLKARVFLNLNIIFSARKARFALFTEYMEVSCGYFSTVQWLNYAEDYIYITERLNKSVGDMLKIISC